MKKLILISLILICAIALFACAEQAPEQTEPPCSHSWMRYGCGATQCIRCNEIMPTEANHIWQGESCEGPATCTICGATTDSADCHLWIPADCQNAKHCSRCSATEGEPIAHVYPEHWSVKDGTLIKKCTRCSEEAPISSDCDHSFSCRLNRDVYECAHCHATVLSADMICLTICDADLEGYYRMELSSLIPGTCLNSSSFSSIYNEYTAASVTILSESFTFDTHWKENEKLIKELRIGDNFATIESLIPLIPAYTLIMSDDVRLIKTDALADCAALRDLYFEGDLPTLENDALWIMATVGRADENGIPYEYAPNAWYHEGAAGFEAYDRILQSFLLKKIEQPEPTLPNITMAEYAERSAQKCLEIAESLFKDWDNDPYAYLTLIPDCDLHEYKRIKDFTLELTKDATDDYERAHLIFDWIVNNIEYDMEARAFAVHRVFDEKRGVCAGYTRLMNDMLAAVGIPAIYARGLAYFGTDCTVEQMVNDEYNSYIDSTHAWVIAYVDGKAIICDPTWGDFDISPKEMAETHRATAMLAGITVIPDGFDPAFYSHIILCDNGSLYQMAYGNLTMASGAAIVFGLSEDSYIINYRFRTKNDGYTSYEGALPTLKSAYRSTIITYCDMGFGLTSCFDIECIEYTYNEVISFAAFEEAFYGNKLNLPYRDQFIIDENGVVYYKMENGQLSVFAACTMGDTVTIPDTVNGMTVTEVFSTAFQNKPYREIHLPDTIEKIGHQAFLGCTMLRELELPKNLKHIEPGAFAWCESLTRVTVHASLETIGFLDAKTFCSPYFLFDAMEPSQLTVTFLGTKEELDAINFYSPWNAENDFVDTEQKEHFLSYVVIAP